MRRVRPDAAFVAVLAGIAYIPLFLSLPGQVAADTKQYLYLDPARLTAGSVSMWDPSTGLGTVTHQNIGYLFPMGPYYTLISWLGIPMWVGQRIWMGSLMLAAATGVAYCARKLGLEGPGRWSAALMYMLSPYILDYLDRASAILMPWAALGWMVGLTIEASRRGGWRYPALFALVVATVGGVNATSILLVVAAPALWLVHAVWVRRETTLRAALKVSGRLAVLCVGVSLWWAAGLWAEGRYGINILRVTETVPTVSKTSSAAEIIRGLGYWYFYGWDKVRPWTLQSVPYLQAPWLIAVSLLLPALSIVLGLATRWAYRSWCLLLVALGTVVAVGAYPFTDPSLFGAVIKGASAGSELALAMRSVDRIVPVVVLGLALMAGSGLSGLHLRRPSWGWVSTVTVCALVAADLPAAWTGGLIASNLVRPSQLPAYWTQAAAYLNGQGGSSRVLGLPGEDFGAYSWGVTEDPVPQGLLDRSYVSRQVVPQGTPASANFVQALDEPIQEGVLDFASLAPVARLMGVGQILLQSDLQYERYHLPLPQVLWSQMTSPQAALGTPTTFGGPNPAPTIRYPLDSELRLGLPTGTPQPPALAVFNVADPRALVRAETATQPIVLAGDGSGVVEAAGAGLLNGDQSIFYAADEAQDPQQFAQAMGDGATLVVTDTNPDAEYDWGSLQADVGQVEQPGVADPSVTAADYDLPVFPGESYADQTTAIVSGIASVGATQYGDSLAFNPEGRPINAFDGNPLTAWEFGAHEAVKGISIEVHLTHPVTASQVNLHQILNKLPVPREVTGVTLTFDGGHAVNASLGPASTSLGGQTIEFSPRTFSTLRLTVDGATYGHDKSYDGLPFLGFTEIQIPGVGPATESLQLPTDLLSEAGPASLAHPLDILMNRSRVSQPPRTDPELSMSRTFDLPTARTFSVAGTAEVNAGDSDYLINQLVGLTPPGPLPAPGPAAAPGPAEVLAANSSSRLDEDRNARANAAVDGNPTTAWIAETGPQNGQWIDSDLSKPITFDHLDLQVLNDGRHSLPSQITISTPSGSRTVDVAVPAVGVGRPQNATTAIPIDFPALSGSHVKVTIDAVRPVTELDYYSTYSGTTDTLPVGIAELGLPGVVQPAAPELVPGVCTGGLLAVDGHPVDVEVAGTTADALNGQQMSLQPCGNSLSGLHLSAGSHTVVTSPRLPIGWSIDQLWLASAAGGAATTLAGTVSAAAPPAPAVSVLGQSPTSVQVKVTGTGKPFWLVLGESYSNGWTADASGRSLGQPHLIDAFANGWYVPALPAGATELVQLSWQPQTIVWAAIGASGVSLVTCLLIAVWPERFAFAFVRRRRRPRTKPEPSSPLPASLALLVGRATGPPLRWPPAVLLAVSWALVAAALSRPATGLIGGAAVLLAVRWRWGRTLCRLAVVALLVALPVYEIVQQVQYRYFPSIEWPSQLSSANDIAWAALVLLGADALAGWRRAAS